MRRLKCARKLAHRKPQGQAWPPRVGPSVELVGRGATAVINKALRATWAGGDAGGLVGRGSRPGHVQGIDSRLAGARPEPSGIWQCIPRLTVERRVKARCGRASVLDCGSPLPLLARDPKAAEDCRSPKRSAHSLARGRRHGADNLGMHRFEARGRSLGLPAPSARPDSAGWHEQGALGPDRPRKHRTLSR